MAFLALVWYSDMSSSNTIKGPLYGRALVSIFCKNWWLIIIFDAWCVLY
jgi:hypothetical protein